jgi:hypothetical protein
MKRRRINMTDEVKTEDMIWASAEYLQRPFPQWGDKFSDWDEDTVLRHIENNKVEAFKDLDNRRLAHMILSTAINFRLAVRGEAKRILKELSDVLESV